MADKKETKWVIYIDDLPVTPPYSYEVAYEAYLKLLELNADYLAAGVGQKIELKQHIEVEKK